MSMGPNLSRVRSARCVISTAFEASAARTSIACPSPASWSRRLRRRSSRRAEAITRAPSRANRTAVSRPMPLDAPTTSTTRSFSETGIGSRDVRTSGFHVHRVQRLGGGHEQPVALRPPKANVGANLRQQDHADALAFGIEDVNAVISRSHPAGADPDVAIGVGPDAVREPRALSGQLHRNITAALL